MSTGSKRITEGPSRLHLGDVEDSSDEDLPSLPGTSQNPLPSTSSSKPKRFKENLEQLNKRRRDSDKKSRKKEKHARRTVASPSPSPEPIVVVPSLPSNPIDSTARSATARKRINVRAISPSGKPRKAKEPMFRAPSDDSDLEIVESASETSGINGTGDTDKPDKRKKRKMSPSSSSCSGSGSESTASPDEDEISEVEEDITMDFNTVVQDKLRPKDNSKAHRLDKLKQARAAKERK